MEKSNMDKSLFFITLSAICVWLVVDAAIGKKYLSRFLSTIFPFMEDGDSSSSSMSTTEVKEAQETAPSSSAMGGGVGRPSAPAINSVPYGATRSN